MEVKVRNTGVIRTRSLLKDSSTLIEIIQQITESRFEQQRIYQTLKYHNDFECMNDNCLRVYK